MYTCICICICVHVPSCRYFGVCIRMLWSMCVRLQKYVHFVYGYMYTYSKTTHCAPVCIYVCIYIYMSDCAYMCVYMYLYDMDMWYIFVNVYMCAQMHACTHVFVDRYLLRPSVMLLACISVYLCNEVQVHIHTLYILT